MNTLQSSQAFSDSTPTPLPPSTHRDTASRRMLLEHLVTEREILLCEAIRILGSRDRAEDILQDAALRCLCSQALDTPTENPSGLLRYMVRNLALDHYRKIRREIPSDHIPETLVSPDTPIEQRLSAKKQLNRTARTLDSLPAKKKYAFIQSRLNERSQVSIAKELNLSPSRVHALIQSAHAQLSKNRLQDE